MELVSSQPATASPNRRFAAAIVLTGIVAGIVGRLCTLLLHGVEYLAWNLHSGTLLDAVEATAPWRRILVLVIAGVLVLVLRALVNAKRPGVGDLRAPARAIRVLGVREGESWARFGPLASAVLFGAIHWFGIPGGPVGALMAGFLGWVLARSILDTRGIGWAWFIHFCQDVLIFTATLVLFV